MTSPHIHSERSGSVEAGRFRGQPAITLAAGDLSATFLPGLGMTGVSLRWRDREHLAVPGGIAALRRGSTLGIPLLAPWANRLSQWRYEAAGVDVDLAGLPLRTDGHGLPIHGLLVGSPDWRVGRQSAGRGRASFEAAIDIDAPAFPFAHRIDVRFTVRDAELQVTTTVTPTGDRSVPVAFGWHPYLQLPGAPRRAWVLTMPACSHVLLDGRGIPTGDATPQRAEGEPIARRTFDDLYRLGRGRAVHGGRRGVGDHDARRCRLRLRPGLGAGRAPVRRPGADGVTHQRAGRRIGACRPPGRGPPGSLHPRRRGRRSRGHVKAFTARAMTRPMMVREMSDCSAIVSFAHRARGITSVGLNAVLVVRPRTR